MRKHTLFEIYEHKKRLYTKSLAPGAPFDEKIVKEKENEFREFDPRHSKLAAMIMQGCTNIGFRKGSSVLYLGSSHGYTASFVSDIIGDTGILFGIDPAPRVMRDFYFLTEQRHNLVPLLADASHPEEFVDKICAVDIVYQDLAQRNQVGIFIANCHLFLKPGGYGLLAVKARSIDVTKKPKQIFTQVRKELEKVFTVIDFKVLEPYQKDHCMIIIKK